MFCNIAAGKVASMKVYEDNQFVAFFDLYPANKGHVLVAPKRHAETLMDLTEEEMAGIALLSQRVAGALKKALNCDGTNLLQNNGEAAGQLIFHAHFHVIPRFKDDGLQLKWPRNLYSEGEMEQYKNKIAPLV